MMNGTLRMALAVTFASVGVPAPAHAVDPSTAKLVAEKAVIVAPSKDPVGELEGYLVIWNGTASGALLANVEGDAFGRIRLVQTSSGLDGDNLTKGERASVPIPPHSELVMLQRGVHLHLTPTRPISPGEELTLKLTFADGTVRTIVGNVQSEQEGNDIHHHDPSRPEWIRALTETAVQDKAG